MITIFKKKVTLTLEEMMNLQRLSNSLRLENEELRLLFQDTYTLIEVLKRERDSVKRIPSQVALGSTLKLYPIEGIINYTPK